MTGKTEIPKSNRKPAELDAKALAQVAGGASLPPEKQKQVGHNT